MPAKLDTVTKMKGVNFHACSGEPACTRSQTLRHDDAPSAGDIRPADARAASRPGELRVIDLVVRMAAVPQLELDASVLAEHLHDVKAKKQQLLAACHIDDDNVSSLMSDMQFAAKLLFLGVHDPDQDVEDRPARSTMHSPRPTRTSPICSNMRTRWCRRWSPPGSATSRRSRRRAPNGCSRSPAVDHDTGAAQILRRAHASLLRRLEDQPAEPAQRQPAALRAEGPQGQDGGVGRRQPDRGPPQRHAVRASTISSRTFAKGVDVYAEFAEDIYHYQVNKAPHKIERFVGKTACCRLATAPSLAGVPEHVPHQGRRSSDRREATSIVYLSRHASADRQQLGLCPRRRAAAARRPQRFVVASDSQQRGFQSVGLSADREAKADPAVRQHAALPRPAPGPHRRQMAVGLLRVAMARSGSTAPSWSRTSSRRWPSSI